MATYRKKSGGTQSEGPQSNSASPASSVAHSNHGSSQNINNNAPKYGTLVPNRIFVGGISSNTTEAELSQLFSKYGNVKATKIIADRAGVSKGYGFVTFESEEEVKYLVENANNVILRERRLNIAPAIKKQPFSRSFETSSPPPATPNLYYSHNGVPYTFHNGMAFFPPTAHQPTLTAVPASDPSIFPSFGPAQNGPPAPYGTPVLVPAPPVFVPAQNYSYQPMPMSNGAQFVYPTSGSSNSSSAGTPEMPPGNNPHLPPQPLPPQFYPPHQFPAQEAFYPHPIYISYNTFSTGEYETHEQQIPNDESVPSTASTPRTEMSERSSNRSPAVVPTQFTVVKNKIEQPRSNTDTPNNIQNKPPMPQSNVDSQVPVVSWQNLKNHAEDRQLQIRDGRRAFHPIAPPQPSQPPPRMMLYQQTTYSSNSVIYPQPNQVSVDGSRNQGQNMRSRQRFNMSTNSMPFIPKFPDNFNNNNPLTMNNNFHDKKMTEVNNGRQQRLYNSKPRKGGRFRSPSSSKPKPTNPLPYLSSCPSQVMQPHQAYDRPMMTAMSGQRWANNPPPMKRGVVYSKRQNGSNPNMGSTNSVGGPRCTKKSSASPERAGAGGDMGGGGDAQPSPISQLALTPPNTPSNAGSNQQVTSKMQNLTLGSTS